MKRFTNDIVDIKRGNTDIQKVYRGENLVWERVSPVDLNLEYLVIGGGGGTPNSRINNGFVGSGGGGAGGYRSSVIGELSGSSTEAEPIFTITLGLSYSLTVGAGGLGNIGLDQGGKGSNSVFSNIISEGGGGGGRQSRPGATGSSGGGNCGQGAFAEVLGIVGQGSNGGNAVNTSTTHFSGGGGGGAGTEFIFATYSNTDLSNGGNGGHGLTSSITGTEIPRAGGGAGAPNLQPSGLRLAGTGGIGGGANGTASSIGFAGQINTGGGGGGVCSLSTNNPGANGGSGIVILRYSTGLTPTFSPGVVDNTYVFNDKKVSVITAAGPTDFVIFN